MIRESRQMVIPGKGVFKSLVAAFLLTVLMEIALLVFSVAMTPSSVADAVRARVIWFPTGWHAQCTLEEGRVARQARNESAPSHPGFPIPTDLTNHLIENILAYKDQHDVAPRQLHSHV